MRRHERKSSSLWYATAEGLGLIECTLAWPACPRARPQRAARSRYSLLTSEPSTAHQQQRIRAQLSGAVTLKCFASGRPQDAVKGQSDLGPRIEKIQHLIGEYSLPPSLPVGTDRRVRRRKDPLAASSGRRAHRSCRPCPSVNVPPAALVYVAAILADATSRCSLLCD